MAAFFNVRKTKVYKNRREASPQDYKKLYRFNKENVEWMANYFIGEKSEKRGGALSSADQMKIFLRYVSDPGYQNGVAEEIGVHQSTVSKVIKDVTHRIIDKANLWIKFPESEEEFTVAKEKWIEKYKFPCAIGAIDCTHVRIPKIEGYGDEYINRKGISSINVQATCDAKELFTSVDAQWPGSVHDSRIWKNSNVNQTMRNCNYDCLLLGDEGYPVRPWLMIPWRNPRTEQQRRYNRIFCRERVIIERMFGQLKARFPILQYKVRITIHEIPSLIVSCFVLHNIAKHLHDPDFEITETDESNPFTNENEERISTNILRRLGEQRREEITNTF